MSLFLKHFLHDVPIFRCSCKFWFAPVALARNLGFSAKELRDIERIIIENQQHLLEAWDEYPGH